MKRIVECVPNFSEGRRPDVVDAIVKAMTSVKNVYLLDQEMDADHNRSVVTIAGSPETIGQAALRGSTRTRPASFCARPRLRKTRGLRWPSTRRAG